MPRAGERIPFLERAMKFILAADSGCWEWTGTKTHFGYGRMPVFLTAGAPVGSQVSVVAHRLMYQELIGPIPSGMHLDHLCRNPPCVNPMHLEPVTAKENTRRSPSCPTAINARKTHCIHGHELAGDNLSAYGKRHGWRICRACEQARIRKPFKRFETAEIIPIRKGK